MIKLYKYRSFTKASVGWLAFSLSAVLSNEPILSFIFQVLARVLP